MPLYLAIAPGSAILNRVPEGIVDNPQMWRILDDPLVLILRPDLALCGLRIFAFRASSPDKPANIDGVLKDPVATAVMAGKGRCRPFAATR